MDQNEEDLVENIEEVASNATKFAVVGNFLSQGATAASMSFLWSLINSL